MDGHKFTASTCSPLNETEDLTRRQRTSEGTAMKKTATPAKKAKSGAKGKKQRRLPPSSWIRESRNRLIGGARCSRGFDVSSTRPTPKWSRT